MGIIKPTMKASRHGKGGGKANGAGKAPLRVKQEFAPQARRAASGVSYMLAAPRFAGAKVKGGKGHGGNGGKGAKGGNGGKGAKGAGQWMFVPAAAVPRSKGSDKGGRAAKGAKRGKDGNDGKGQGKVSKYKFMDKLDAIDAERKVWVGGLPEDVTRGNIVEHFKTAGINPGTFEILRKGSACISFKTSEDATTAISTLNGSDLAGSSIEVDVWTKKEKKERPEGEARPKKKKGLGVKQSILKKKVGNTKMQEKLKEIDNSLKAWVGGLKKETTWKTVKEHFVGLGHEVDICDLTKPGVAVVTFKTAEDAESAIASVNGTEIEDKSIKVDTWGKAKKIKEEA